MRALLRRLNDLAVFDASRWPAREAVARTLGVVGVAAVLFSRLLQFRRFPGMIAEVAWVGAWFRALDFLPARLMPSWDMERWYAWNGYTHAQIRWLWLLRLGTWLLESGILGGYIVAWLTRGRATSPARGFAQTVFPLMLGAMPFAIVSMPYTFEEWMPARSTAHAGVLAGISGLLLGGAMLNLVGLLTLRRAFTIMTEARSLVRHGVYRFIRHPLYAGHFAVYLGYTLLHLHVATVALYLLFVAGQAVRARNEERKLAAAFPEYEEYRAATGMFFPSYRSRT